ncbi:uncharacterized protein BO66DRAFT_421575 [Aspergillus aculeatinus CBS 121060]|uniref:Uncharacterized protein n=1 Tax=Aspergillus aculeatinus CBS 121060 TaxID=1448322 RepID=A0ACD1H4Q5_9EURO|nr:hypothetical protein BO66DRAFT_421575 [Aspergillus aculeatinus CBS 121060]RAH68539.1 hypothetical protein BO66DRAFT_421575 [Aspergillus aculeatinus CBS 121060]
MHSVLNCTIASYLTKGISRGIGLALVRLLASKPSTEVAVVFAAARTQADALTRLVAQFSGRVSQVEMDVTENRNMGSAAATVEKVLAGRGLDTMTDLDSTFRTNVTGAHMVTSAFLELLEHGTLEAINVANVRPQILHLWFHRQGVEVCPCRKITKAALSMLTVQYVQSFAREGFIFMIISSSWVKADFGSDNAKLTPQQSATAVFDLISSATSTHNSKFYHIYVNGLGFHDGAEVPW